MIPPIGAVGPLGAGEWSVGPVTGPTASAEAGLAPTSGAGSFGSALTNALNSMENTQANATQAAQGLATGQLTDPTQAVTAVENAALEMDYASQIRTKVVDAVNTIFQTQV